MPEILQPVHSFHSGEVISTAWNLLKKYFWTLIVLFLITLLPSFLDTIVNLIIQQIPGATAIVTDPFTNITELQPIGIWATIVSVISMLTGILGVWLGLGLIKANLQILEDKKPAYSVMTSTPWIKVARAIGGGILITLAVVIGFIALIIPGIYLSVRFSLFQYYIVEGYGAIDAIKASWAATEGNFWKLAGIGFMYVGILILGVLALGIGLLVAIPLVALAQAYVYKALKKNTPTHLQPVLEVTV